MKPIKLASIQRKKKINAKAATRDSKRHTDRKAHDTKGKDTHARRFR